MYFLGSSSAINNWHPTGGGRSNAVVVNDPKWPKTRTFRGGKNTVDQPLFLRSPNFPSGCIFRSTYSLGLMAFARPLSILARPLNVPRVKTASARLGMHIHTIQQLQQSRDKDHTPLRSPLTEDPLTKPAPPQVPTDLEMERHVPGFSNLGVDAKILARKKLPRDGIPNKKDPALMGELAGEDKEIRGKDRWYKKMFRGIAWGPTILINAILAMLWW